MTTSPEYRRVRASKFFSTLFVVVGTAMVAERLFSGDGQLVAGVLIALVGIAFFFNWVDVWPHQVRIRTPFREVNVVAPSSVPGKPRHIQDAQTGEIHALPLAVLATEVLQPN